MRSSQKQKLISAKENQSKFCCATKARLYPLLFFCLDGIQREREVMSSNNGGAGAMVGFVAFMIMLAMFAGSCSGGSHYSSSSSSMSDHEKKVAEQSHEYKEARDAMFGDD